MTTSAVLHAPAVHPWLAHEVTIDSITPEVEGVATYHLAFTNAAMAADYRFAPGQFNMLYLPGVGEVPISLSADPASTRTWAHTIRVAGNTTRTLAQLGQGGRFGLRGPFGTAWPLAACAGADIVLVAGGIGLAPLRPAIYHLLDHASDFGRLTLLYGARTPDALLYRDEYQAWSQRGLFLQTTVDRAAPGWLGNVGVVPLLLDRLRPFDPANTMLLMCGPEVMMHYSTLSALARGLPRERAWVSLERNMQCAVALCGHCQLGPAFLCKDGPVFRYDKIEPFLKVVGL
jgi:NAD(P)H-flavin reductase